MIIWCQSSNKHEAAAHHWCLPCATAYRSSIHCNLQPREGRHPDFVKHRLLLFLTNEQLTLLAGCMVEQANVCMLQSYTGLHAEMCREDTSPKPQLVLPLHVKQAPLVHFTQLNRVSPF